MTTQHVVETVVALWPLVGASGTALKALGAAWGKPGLVALGARLEAVFVDFPKALKGA